MSTLLWVEDFEDKQYRKTTSNVFGPDLNVGADNIPEEVNDLRDFLRARQIVLATNYAEAAQIIEERLPDIDGIVLDIDLALVGEDFDKDILLVEELLMRWHQYEPDADDAEASYDEARSKMKMIAGYHLYVDLVVNRGFPRHRILFCSQHGDQLEKALTNSFDLARMERPDVLRKSDPRVTDWIANVRGDLYTKLRRWIILACREMLDRLRHGQTRFLMPLLPGVSDGQLTPVDAENLLKTLQLLMPAQTRSDEERKNVFRLFIRTLTQDWDKIDYKSRDMKNPVKAFAAALTYARHWTSHSAKALTRLTEADVAFLFMIALRACFEMKKAKLEDYEIALMSLIGDETRLDMGQVKQDYINTYNNITLRWQGLPDNKKTPLDKGGCYFANRINDLELAGGLEPSEHETGLRQIFWHQLHWAIQAEDFSPEQRHFSGSPFLSKLTSHLYHPGFS